MSPAIEARDVWKVYQPGDVQAVKGVSLSVAAGEICLILGPSGSGKTTFLQILGTMLTPTRGDVLFEGRPVASFSRRELTEVRRRDVGFVFQFFNLLHGMTALENVELVLRLQGDPQARAKAERILESVGLKDSRHQYPSQLSGGQRQRVAVARALAHRPKVIFADEPTGALDSANGLGVMLILTAMAREAGSAVIVVTHDLRMRQLAQKVYKMEDGVLKDWAKEWEPSWSELLEKGSGQGGR